MPTLWPATVSEVERGVTDAVFELALRLIVALPVPEDGAMAAQLAALDAVHEQLGPLAVTVIDPLPPAGLNGLPEDDASRVTLHAIPSCAIW
jgi:hypothetical protein